MCLLSTVLGHNILQNIQMHSTGSDLAETNRKSSGHYCCSLRHLQLCPCSPVSIVSTPAPQIFPIQYKKNCNICHFIRKASFGNIWKKYSRHNLYLTEREGIGQEAICFLPEIDTGFNGVTSGLSGLAREGNKCWTVNEAECEWASSRAIAGDDSEIKTCALL